MEQAVVIHSKLSFSGRERWRACPISVHMSEGMPDKSGAAAEEGTLAHAIGEHYVRWACNLPGKIEAHAQNAVPPAGMDVGDVAAWNEVLRQHGREYAVYIQALAGAHGAVVLEQKVAIPSISAHLFGTGDCFVWEPGTNTLHVVDYKYGFKYVEVGTADNANPQLAAYAVAACETFGMSPSHIVLHIVQPRIGAPRTLVIEDAPAWLASERRKLANEVAAVESPSSPRPGAHCTYCKGKSKCGATQNALAIALEAHCNLIDLRTISDDEALDLYASRTALKSFLEDIEERVKGLAKTGHARVTIKESIGRKMWADEEDAALTFAAMGMNKLLRPVAVGDAEAHLPEALQKMLITRGQPAKSIKIANTPEGHVIAGVFRKYASGNAAPAAQIDAGTAGSVFGLPA